MVFFFDDSVNCQNLPVVSKGVGMIGNDAKQVMLVHLKRAIWEGREFYLKKNVRFACRLKKCSYLCTRKRNGAIAQLVEHRTENPCVPGSIPGGTTKKTTQVIAWGVLVIKRVCS